MEHVVGFGREGGDGGAQDPPGRGDGAVPEVGGEALIGIRGGGPVPASPYGGCAPYFWHGRVVPRWAVLEPTVTRIATEANVEVRRCAIESMGWARFTEEAELTLLDESPDPGNPGQRLSLHSVPGKVWGTPAHVLVCTNGSPDLDGGRHTFGLLVPVTVDSALGAAAWGYGLTADEYAQLQRRA